MQSKLNDPQYKAFKAYLELHPQGYTAAEIAKAIEMDVKKFNNAIIQARRTIHKYPEMEEQIREAFADAIRQGPAHPHIVPRHSR